MADVQAFRGFRYNLGRVGSLSEVICPPYDVIDATLQHKLQSSHAANAIHLEKRPDEEGDDRYRLAAHELAGWLNQDILVQDSHRSFYLLEQEYTYSGQTYRRRGFFARVRVEPLGSGKIYPHEQTLPKARADRLSLYRATGFNISPIFALYPDEENVVIHPLEQVTHAAPPIVAVDHLGIINRLWPVFDQRAISETMSRISPNPLYIADGHHRYETALNYLNELLQVQPDLPEDHPARYCLMLLVGMSDPGLIIQPTHRLVNFDQPLDRAALWSLLEGPFEIIQTYEDASACWEHLQLEDSQQFLGMGHGTTWSVLKLREEKVMQAVAADHSPEWQRLAVSRLHQYILQHLLVPRWGAATCQYVHTLAEISSAQPAPHVTFLVPPVSMENVQRISENHETMPAKSTYFFPKIPTGLVFNSLKHH